MTAHSEPLSGSLTASQEPPGVIHRADSCGPENGAEPSKSTGTIHGAKWTARRLEAEQTALFDVVMGAVVPSLKAVDTDG